MGKMAIYAWGQWDGDKCGNINKFYGDKYGNKNK